MWPYSSYIIYSLIIIVIIINNRGMTLEAVRTRRHFCLALCFFRPPSRALVVITWRGDGWGYMMWLGLTVKWVQLLKIKALVSSLWATGCMFGDCVCVIWLDMTTPPWSREKYGILLLLLYYYWVEFKHSLTNFIHRLSQEIYKCKWKFLFFKIIIELGCKTYIICSFCHELMYTMGQCLINMCIV